MCPVENAIRYGVYMLTFGSFHHSLSCIMLGLHVCVLAAATHT